MDLSEANLRSIFVDLRAIGPSWPYNRGTTEEIETYLRDVVVTLQQSTRLIVEAHRDHYGSGYASYVHLFCHKRGRKRPVDEEGEIEIPGMDLYICRLAPVAAFGPGSQTRHAQGAMAYTTLNIEQIGQKPPGDWTWEINELRTKLSRYGYSFPGQAELARKLPFQLKAKRYRASYSPSRLFDAIFFWDE